MSVYAVRKRAFASKASGAAISFFHFEQSEGSRFVLVLRNNDGRERVFASLRMTGAAFVPGCKKFRFAGVPFYDRINKRTPWRSMGEDQNWRII